MIRRVLTLAFTAWLSGACHAQGAADMADELMIRRIATIDAEHAETMKGNPTSFREESFPFYQGAKVVFATIRLRHKPVELAYLDFGQELWPINTEDALYRANARAALALDASTAAAYGRFFVSLLRPQLQIAERADQVRWLPSVDKKEDQQKAKAEASQKLRPLSAAADPAGGVRVTFTATTGDKKLVEESWRFSFDGRLADPKETVLQEGLPIPYVM
jgi:hypothetical protein